MGSVYNSIPTWLAGALQREFGLSTFVESGLGQGTSALWAERHFDTCISVENDLELINKFTNNYPNSNARIICGDSGVEFAFLIHGIASPALFWLDGHTDDYTPIIAELASINASQLDHIVMVDDLRLFGTLPAWPKLNQVMEIAQDYDKRTTFEVDDVLIAVPNRFSYKTFEIILKG